MSGHAYLELNFDDEKPRGRFGERETAERKTALPSRAGFMEFTFILRRDLALSIAVTEARAGQGTPWIYLPKSQISYELLGRNSVFVSMPEWLARQKSLI